MGLFFPFMTQYNYLWPIIFPYICSPWTDVPPWLIQQTSISRRNHSAGCRECKEKEGGTLPSRCWRNYGNTNNPSRTQHELEHEDNVQQVTSFTELSPHSGFTPLHPHNDSIWLEFLWWLFSRGRWGLETWGNMLKDTQVVRRVAMMPTQEVSRSPTSTLNLYV